MARLVLACSFDGLAISPLSPYGSSWVTTPHFDRWASAGAVFDRCIVPSDDPHRVLSALWDASAGETNGLAAATAQGLQPSLITDSLAVSELPQADRFAEIGFVETPANTTPCDEIEATALSRLIAAVFDELERLDDDESAFLWVHSDCLTRCWDAPHHLLPAEDLEEELEYVEENADGVPLDLLEEDGGPKVIMPRAPKIFQTVDPPRLQFGQAHDPDITLAWMNNYAAQIRLIDLLLGFLSEAVTPQRELTFAVMGTSGFALGEHGAIGHRCGPLRSPSIQVPLMVRGPGIPTIRCRHPCSPLAVWDLLLPSSATASSGLASLLSPAAWKAKSDEFSPCVVTHSAGGRSVAETSSEGGQAASPAAPDAGSATGWTTPAWLSVREVGGDGTEQVALFAKPDDRCDANNVANRLGEVVEGVQQVSPGEAPHGD